MTPGQSGPGSGSNEGVLRIPQCSSITGASPSDRLVSYSGHLLGVGITFQQKYIWCILQPQATGPRWVGVLPLCRDTFGVFYSASWLGNQTIGHFGQGCLIYVLGSWRSILTFVSGRWDWNFLGLKGASPQILLLFRIKFIASCLRRPIREMPMVIKNFSSMQGSHHKRPCAINQNRELLVKYTSNLQKIRDQIYSEYFKIFTEKLTFYFKIWLKL